MSPFFRPEAGGGGGRGVGEGTLIGAIPTALKLNEL